MTVLDVHPPGYALAARTVGGEIASTAVRAADNLAYALAGCADMAGSDDVGARWGAAYDAAVSAAMSATTDAANAAFCVAALLEQTGINYAGAEAACVPGESAAESQVRWAQSSAPLRPALPSAVGTGRARARRLVVAAACDRTGVAERAPGSFAGSGRAWRAAADELVFVLPHLDSAVGEVLLQRAPEVNDATSVLHVIRDHLVALCRALSRPRCRLRRLCASSRPGAQRDPA